MKTLIIKVLCDSDLHGKLYRKSDNIRFHIGVKMTGTTHQTDSLYMTSLELDIEVSGNKRPVCQRTHMQ